jgi:hypothetical protein
MLYVLATRVAYVASTQHLMVTCSTIHVLRIE